MSIDLLTILGHKKPKICYTKPSKNISAANKLFHNSSGYYDLYNVVTKKYKRYLHHSQIEKMLNITPGNLRGKHLRFELINDEWISFKSGEELPLYKYSKYLTRLRKIEVVRDYLARGLISPKYISLATSISRSTVHVYMKKIDFHPLKKVYFNQKQKIILSSVEKMVTNITFESTYDASDKLGISRYFVEKSLKRNIPVSEHEYFLEYL